jgi:hypothetical protein
MSRLLPPMFFFGADPQQSASKKACDGAVTVCMALDQRNESNDEDWKRAPAVSDFFFCPIYIRPLRGLATAEWSGFIHSLHLAFKFTNGVIDWGAGGGGPLIARDLKNRRQKLPVEIRRNKQTNVDFFHTYKETDVRPIFSRNPDDAVPVGDPILTHYKRGDAGIEALYSGQPMTKDDKLFDLMFTDLQAAFEAGCVALLPPIEKWPKSAYASWPKGRIKILQQAGVLADQLVSASTVMREDDPETEKRSASGARHFAWGGRSDIAKTLVYAFGGFLVTLKYMEWDFEDGGGFGGSSGTVAGEVIGGM